jgi:hypothetical protein
MKTKLLKKVRRDLRIITIDNKKYYLQEAILYNWHWNTIFSGELSKCNNKMHSRMRKKLLDLGYIT